MTKALVVLLALALACGVTQARIARNAHVVKQFIKLNPCPDPAAGRRCKGWEVDHIQPLCAHGADALHNLQWLTVQAHRMKTRTDVRFCRQLRRAAVATGA